VIRRLLSASLSFLILAQSAFAADVVKPVELATPPVALDSQAVRPLSLPALDAGLTALPSAAVAPEGNVVLYQAPAETPANAFAAPQAHAGIVAASDAPLSAPKLAADFAPESLAELDLAIDPSRKYFASPEDWRDESVYFVFLDRFARAEGYKTHGDQKDGVSRHGGNIRGVTEKMDYLAASGVSTILISPVVTNLPDSYHGYAPIHMLQVDPHLGTMEDYKEMVREAHKRGIRVVMDWVTNHSGPIFEYKDGSKFKPEGEPKEIGERTAPFFPKELATDDNFTRRGVIDNWNDHKQATEGDFPPNYRHFAGDNPATQDRLVKILQWWMKETDIDGVRLDAVKHFAPGLFPRLRAEIRARAAELGKKNFLVIPENSSGVDAEVGEFMTEAGSDAAYNYPAYRRENYALHGKAPTTQLEESTRKSVEVLGPKASYLLRFIDNQDTYRFLRGGEPLSILKMAMAYLFSSIGIPMVYYGTEQAFTQMVDRLDPEGPMLPADPRNREDMFAGGLFKSKSSEGDKFDPASEMFRWLAKLSSIRKAHSPLRRGEQYFRYSEPSGPGVSAFSRIHDGKEVLFVMNTASEPRSADMWVDGGITPAGVALVDELDASYTVTTHAPQEGGSRVTVTVPPHGVRVLVKK
jgi:alpha-amylase